MPNILITGGAKRIGRNLAIRFAKLNYNVAIAYHHSQNEAFALCNEIKSLGLKSIAVNADVRNKMQVSKAIADSADFLGGLDVLVNNAGVFPDKRKLEDVDEELWDDTFNINLRGEFYFAQAYASVQTEQGRIINIASVGGAEVWRGRIPYNVSKSGVFHLTKALALELAPRIAVNCVAPGIIQLKNDSPDEQISVPAERIPMLRYGNADDMFDAVRFFAEASPYITGQTLFVDGGYHLSRR